MANATVSFKVKTNWFVYYSIIPINFVRVIFGRKVWVPDCICKVEWNTGEWTGP